MSPQGAQHTAVLWGDFAEGPFFHKLWVLLAFLVEAQRQLFGAVSSVSVTSVSCDCAYFNSKKLEVWENCYCSNELIFPAYLQGRDLVLCANKSLTVTIYRWDHPLMMGTNSSSHMETLILISRHEQGCYLSYSCVQHFSIRFMIHPNSGYKRCYHRIRKWKGRMVRDLLAHMCWLWLLCTSVWRI